MSVITDYLAKTTKVLHVYADGTSGDDDNTGKSGSPVKTITKALELVPYAINYNVILHLSGTFTFTDYIYVDKQMLDSAFFVIDGGDSVVEAASGSTGLTISGSTTSTITLTSAGWTINQWRGFWIFAGGEYRLIHSNTADTLYACQYFTSSPSGTFDIIKPATTFYASPTKYIRLNCKGNSGTFVLQRMAMDGVGITTTGTVYTYLAGLYSSFTSTTGAYVSYGKDNMVSCNYYVKDPDNLLSNLTSYKVGLSAPNGYMIFSNDFVDYLYGGCFKQVTFKGPFFGPSYGVTSNKILIDGGKTYFSTSAMGAGTSCQPLTIFSSPDVGLQIKDSPSLLLLDATALIDNCASHGIEVDNSQLKLDGAVSGSGNAGAGVYAHNGSTVTTKAGTAPTLTGTAGDLAVTNPASADATWAQINGGDTLVSAAERTLVKAE